jgi:hypothetical protein
MNIVMSNVWRLETVAHIQGVIREAIIDDNEQSARWLDAHLSEMPRGYVLAAMAIASELMRIKAKHS